MIPLVAASEAGTAQTLYVFCIQGVIGLPYLYFIKKWNFLESKITEGDNPVHVINNL